MNTVEAATSLGATRRSSCARCSSRSRGGMILLGVNQTILFALSMVVIAGLIGGGGLGAVVTSGLYSNPALAILAGFVIVVMAMALDRSTEAMAARTDPAQRHLDERGGSDCACRSLARGCRGDRRRDRGLEGARRQRALPRRGRAIRPAARRSRSGCSRRSRSSSTTCRTRRRGSSPSPSGSGSSSSSSSCCRCRSSSCEAPWFTTVGGLTAIAFVVSGLRPALTTLAMLGLIGFMGVWALSMDTLSQVLVATAMAVVDRRRARRAGRRERPLLARR